MVAHDYEPTLAVDEVDDLLEMAKRPDLYGTLPAVDGWVATWDLNYAAAEGWALKASKAVADFDYSDDAGSYSRQQVYAMAKEQEKSYRSRALGSLPISRNDDLSEVLP